LEIFAHWITQSEHPTKPNAAAATISAPPHRPPPPVTRTLPAQAQHATPPS
jgi:hypothetical protein